MNVIDEHKARYNKERWKFRLIRKIEEDIMVLQVRDTSDSKGFVDHKIVQTVEEADAIVAKVYEPAVAGLTMVKQY